MKRRMNVLIWSAMAGLVTTSLSFMFNEPADGLGFTRGAVIGGVMAAIGTYLRRRRRIHPS